MKNILLFLFPLFITLNVFAQEPASTVVASGAPVDVTVINTPNVNVVNKVQLDVASEVGTGDVAPTIPEITGAMIMQPFVDYFDSSIHTVMPAHESLCPTSSMVLFRRHITLDAHCVVINDVKPFLHTTMMFFYAAFAFFIIIRA